MPLDGDTNALVGIMEAFIKMPPYDYVTTRMISMEFYERALGIQKKSTDNNGIGACPMPLVTMKASTNYMADTVMARVYEKILMLEIPKLTNMSLTELLRLPTYEFDILLESATRIVKEKDKKLTALTNGVNNAMAQNK